MSNLNTLKDRMAIIELRLAEMQTELESAKAEIEAQIEAELQREQPPPPPGPNIEELVAPGLEFRRLKPALERLAAGQTQDEILTIYLEEASSFADRGVLFLKEGNQYVPWKTEDFRIEAIPAVLAEEEQNPIARAASQQRIIVRVRDLEQVFPWLKDLEPPPQAALSVPLVFGDLVPAVLYLDTSGQIPLDSVELISHWTVLVLKNQQLQAMATGSPAAEEIEAPAAEEPPVTELEEASAAPRPQPSPFRFTPQEAPATQAPAPAEETAGVYASSAVETETKTAAPPPSPAPAPSSEEERFHAEARRLSRLLVSEIKLYNGDQVSEGREQKDLYSRLKAEIDAGRERYQARVNPLVAARKDYYHEELVRILGMGNEKLMGDDYPGAVLSSDA